MEGAASCDSFCPAGHLSPSAGELIRGMDSHTHFTWKMQKASLWVRELLCVEGKQNNYVFWSSKIFFDKISKDWQLKRMLWQTCPSKILFKQTFLILVLNFQSWVLPKDWTPTTVFTFHAHWVRLGNICSIICILYACLLAVLWYL